MALGVQPQFWVGTEATSVMADIPSRVLMIFAKQPHPGWSKTRLAADVGMEPADVLYQAFLADVATRARRLQERLSVHVRWVHTPSSPSFAEVLDRVAPGSTASASFIGYDYQDLARQQYDQLLTAESDGFAHIIIMGADTPHVELEVLLESFRLLDDNDVVVGPSTDGGYYLLGLHAGCRLIAGLDRGSCDNVNNVVMKASRRGYSIGFVTPTIDIDTAADLGELLSRGLLHTAVCPKTCHAIQDLRLWA